MDSSPIVILLGGMWIISGVIGTLIVFVRTGYLFAVLSRVFQLMFSCNIFALPALWILAWFSLAFLLVLPFTSLVPSGLIVLVASLLMSTKSLKRPLRSWAKGCGQFLMFEIDDYMN